MNGFNVDSQKTNLRNSNQDQEISRILTAAVVNSHFRQMLLSNPVAAIEMGFGGEAFSLLKEEKRQVAAIHASSLADFARQLSTIAYMGCTAGD